ncbi:hypothetical protein [Streptomyces sp. NPDC058869]|uniref:hypothetical protein n=1 Tax=Streptomyces sp. NPDC058869 TaxID=3346659 RepID=UPI003683FC8D
MNRACRVDGCTRQARPQRHLCQAHRNRISRHGDPNFTQWGTADEADVELVIRERRPVEGLTRLERVLIARGLTERQVPAAEVARIVGVDKRTVERWRSRDRQKQAA